MSSDVVTIALATGSAIKKDATQIAFQKLFPSSEVQLECFVTTSDINEQPIGFEETMRGRSQGGNYQTDLIRCIKSPQQYENADTRGRHYHLQSGHREWVGAGNRCVD